MMSKLSFSLLKSDDANWNLAVHSEAGLSLWGGGGLSGINDCLLVKS